MLLSITMMVRNEEKYLDKTLSSLQPLMKNINSELIILDTGSSDKSIDIAKKYTDKIYCTKWNNNFAQMRNQSISYAKGEWILVLDADEELLDCNNLIEFFNSNLYKKYNCASIELRNIHSEDEKAYSKGSILRLFKNDKGFKYEGAIHEQPTYREPIYNNIALFKHYGYMYVNEELRQTKLKRNEQILFQELKKNPNDPYVNFQLGKNHLASDKHQEALEYINKAYVVYSKSGYVPIYIISNLARLYICLSEFEKCEKLCTNYMKKDNKNIDICYYLGLTQKTLGKYKHSIKTYQRYIFLIENYDVSTQANNIECDGDTLSLKENAEIDIVNMCYELKMYNEIIKKIDNMEIEQIKKIYLQIFMSLYKLGNIEKILDIYKKISDSIVEKNTFKLNLETMITIIKEDDRSKIYEMFSMIDGNYAVLNNVRNGEKLSIEELNQILKNEKESYYSDLIYFGLNQDHSLTDLLNGMSNVNIQNHFDYLINHRRDCILDLYNYLLEASNTLDLNKLSIYSSLSKSLLLYGNLKYEKYENLFLMYITYNYDYLRQASNKDLTDEQLMIFAKNEEDVFIIKITMIQKNKEFNKLKYIKEMKILLIDNHHHKKGIEILIEKFKKELNESEEVKILNSKYKAIIEENINLGNINESIQMIKEYKEIFDNNETFNLNGIINTCLSKFMEADKDFKMAYINNRYDDNVIFNIAYVKEKLNDFDNAKKFYLEAVKLNCNLKEEVEEILDKIVK
ncbi:glycosyltransferase [Romboutsia sedimentorum]|uniref:Glycosyltransferase n=1 Tax=Romboutsia sedimentorum TaxID=1368474 RepID=A0ABT7E6Z6_9FIRM|nr:glycosyltransferase [Romboutsia sedimentorum]MDK2562697.1 glycosyltransferase [Romboutsia sedimentorum]